MNAEKITPLIKIAEKALFEKLKGVDNDVAQCLRLIVEVSDKIREMINDLPIGNSEHEQTLQMKFKRFTDDLFMESVLNEVKDPEIRHIAESLKAAYQELYGQD